VGSDRGWAGIERDHLARESFYRSRRRVRPDSNRRETIALTTPDPASEIGKPADRRRCTIKFAIASLPSSPLQTSPHVIVPTKLDFISGRRQASASICPRRGPMRLSQYVGPGRLACAAGSFRRRDEGVIRKLGHSESMATRGNSRDWCWLLKGTSGLRVKRRKSRFPQSHPASAGMSHCIQSYSDFRVESMTRSRRDEKMH
jgi:hypothetical protein